MLLTERAVDHVAARYVRQLLEHTPWIHLSPDDEWWPVRHNLTRTFLDQLADELGGEPVEELWILSPFFDPAAEGLRQLLLRLKPETTHLLFQQERTSADPAALARVIAGQSKRVLIHPAGKQGVSYLHAKFYLVRTASRAVCLQGSANLSQVAMLRTTDDGNVELCNLLVGKRETFDYLLDELEIQEPVTLETLKVQLTKDEGEGEALLAAPFYLTGGDWDGKTLALHFRGTPPPLSDMRFLIGSEDVRIGSAESEGNRLVLRLDARVHDLLRETVAICLQWTSGDATKSTNPVFIYNRINLDAEMQARADGESFKGLGSLDIDEDLEQLVAELECALVIDRRSVWRLAGNRATVISISSDELDAKPLSYDEIDYEALRRHPKTQQYLRRGHDSSVSERSRLQINLGMITGRFDEIVRSLGPSSPASTGDVEPSSEEAETEEEREAEDAERQQRRRSTEQRLRQIFKRFIGRYLRGIESPDFREFVGFEVVTNNYIIFDHLLWELSLRDWFEPELSFLIEAQLRAWTMFWGATDEPGYLDSLDQKQREVALSWVRDHKSDARLLAAIWYAAAVTASAGVSVDYTNLRDFWRQLLVSTPYTFDIDVLTDAWVIAAQLNPINPPRAGDISEGLAFLANHESEDELLRRIERDFAFPEGVCRFERRPKMERRDLCVRTSNEQVSPLVGHKLLERWMRFERCDSYRTSFGRQDDKLKVVLLDEMGAIFWNEADDYEVELGGVQPARWPWEPTLNAIHAIAAEIGQADLELVRSKKAAMDKSGSSHR